MKLNFSRDGYEYSIRAAQLTDAADVSALINICSQNLYGRDEMEVEKLLNDWQFINMDLQQDSLLIFADDELIACADLVGKIAPFVRFPLMARVHPDFRGKGFGWLINRWAAGRVTELLPLAAQGKRVFISSRVNEKDQAGMQLLEDLGGNSVRYNWLMERGLSSNLPVAEVPHGVSLRVAELDEYKELFLLYRDAFRDNWGFIEIPEEEGFQFFIERFVQDPNYQPELFLLAEKETKKVGMLIASPSSSHGEEYGWISLLAVPAAERKQGIGKALLLRGLAELKQFGSQFAGLGVDSENLTGATELYKQVGMSVVTQFVQYEVTIRDGEDMRGVDL